jgi:hypothetical protein
MPVSASKQVFLKRLSIACMVLAMFFVLTEAVRDASLDKSTAYLEAQNYVAQRLLRPETVEFPPFSTQGVTVEYLGSHRYRISGYLDSLNSFGNRQRSGYWCVIRYIGTGEWVCEKIAFQ